MLYGLIAGNGQFPFLVLDGATRAGAALAVVAIREETDPKIEELVTSDNLVWVGIGQLGKMINFFKKRDVTRAMMAGQVKHVQIFSGALPDAKMLKVLIRLPRRNTDALIGGVADELAREGIELIDSTFFVKDHIPRAGVLTRRAPNLRERKDIEYGLEVAGEMSRLDLGQTVVIRDRACVAIEAMEGTNAVIKRAGTLARVSLTIVKVAKPNQDMRFDVPVVGLSTIETMMQAHATCLSITAEKTLLFDQKEVIRLADKERIAIVAV